MKTTRRGLLAAIAGAGAAATVAETTPKPGAADLPSAFVEMTIRCSGGYPDRPCTETRRMAVYNDPELGSTELPRFVCAYHRERQAVDIPEAHFVAEDGSFPREIRIEANEAGRIRLKVPGLPPVDGIVARRGK